MDRRSSGPGRGEIVEAADAAGVAFRSPAYKSGASLIVGGTAAAPGPAEPKPWQREEVPA